MSAKDFHVRYIPITADEVIDFEVLQNTTKLSPFHINQLLAQIPKVLSDQPGIHVLGERVSDKKWSRAEAVANFTQDSYVDYERRLKYAALDQVELWRKEEKCYGATHVEIYKKGRLVGIISFPA